ncbi:MAG: peptidoglycan DD-metalloendopeptidase family protein [Nocardioidaceae bacterium]
MRPFPRTARPRPATAPWRRVSLAALVGVLLATLVSSPMVQPQLAAADDHLKDRHKHVKKQLSAAHDDLSESSARLRNTTAALETARANLASAQSALASARARLQAARIRDEQMQQELDQAMARLEQARTDLATGQQAVVDKRQQIADMLADTYQQGDPEMLGLMAMLDSATPSDLTRQAEIGGAVVDSQVQALDELRAAEVLLEVREQQVEDAKADTAAKRREAARLLAERQKYERQAQAAKQAVHDQVVGARNAKAAADAARAHDLAKLKRLEREDKRLQEMLRRRAAAAAAKNGGSAPQPSDGYLSYPVNGPVTSPFGYRIHPIYGYYSLHDGTDFGAGCGAPLYSAADGRVIASYWNTAYGNRMVIDNGFVRGVGLATVYNHAIRYTVGVGDSVKRGQVIGYVGTTGWSTGCHLHFTVMVNGKPVDPMNWL